MSVVRGKKNINWNRRQEILKKLFKKIKQIIMTVLSQLVEEKTDHMSVIFQKNLELSLLQSQFVHHRT